MNTFSDFGITIPSGATGNIKVKCPKCAHTHSPAHRNNKDLSVNIEEGVWNCHRAGCDFTGTLNNKPYPTAPRIYTKPRTLPSPPPDATSRMMKWFADRHITPEVVKRNKITVMSGNGKDWIAFPYFRDGEHINTTYRQFPAKEFRQEKDAERIFYGLDDIGPDDDWLIICEGQLDKLAFEVAGFTNCLSVPDGALSPNQKPSEVKMSYLASALELFDRMNRVYLACDSDAPGQALTEELSRRIGRHKCWTVTWPTGIKDANDALAIGPAEVATAIQTAKPHPVQGIWYADSLRGEIKQTYDVGYDPGIRIGIPVLDDFYRPIQGMVTVVTGWSSHGKSTMLDHILVALAKNHGWKIGVFSPENQPVKDHLSRLAEIYIGKAFDKGVGNRMTPEEREQAVDWLDDHFAVLLPENATLEEILELARISLFQRGLNGLVLDPWNEIEHHRPPGKSETEYVSECLTIIRKWSRTNNIKTWVLAHPAKPNGPDQSTKHAPELFQISGSNNWWNKCDYGLSIWRNPSDNQVWSECHVKKIRFKPTGKVGIVDFRVNYQTRHLETRIHEDA